MAASEQYTLPEAARILRRHPTTLRRWIREGKLPATRVGHRYRLDGCDLARVPRTAHGPGGPSDPDRLALSALDDLWDNAEDAVYDDWRAHYEVDKPDEG